MTTMTDSDGGNRVVSAFFDTVGAAQKATDDLIAAGIPREHISRTGGENAAAGTAVHGSHRSFWDEMKSLFLPENDATSYAEGLNRGGILLAVRSDEANYTRILDILDTDGAVDMDEREGEWRSEGWSHETARGSIFGADVAAPGLAVGTPLSAGANALAMPSGTVRTGEDSHGTLDGTLRSSDDAWRTDAAARAAALDGSVPATAAAARDDAHGRSRLRSYVMNPAMSEPEATPGSFSPQTDAARIVPHMDVISADGQTIGQVDHLDGPDRIKLAKNTSPDGQHHMVPFAWIDHVDAHVHLRKTLAEIKAGR